MARKDFMFSNTSTTLQFAGGGTNRPIITDSGVTYLVYTDQNNDLSYKKSSDYGYTWGDPVILVSTISVFAMATWYDRWSGIAADLIHVAYTEGGADDILYLNINTASADAVTGPVVVFAGGSAVSGDGSLSITRARGGNLVVSGSIDAGAEDGAWESTDTGATWGSAIADPSEASAADQYLLAPGWNADTQDVMLFFWDASAAGGGEISVKRYDNSADSWAGTSIAASMTDLAVATAYPQFSVAVDLANSRNILVAWSAADTLNADLRCFIVDDTTITEVTNVVQNSTDDQGLCAIGINTDNGDWYVFYAGKSDGSETWLTSVNIYYKVSTDDGTTWGAETLLTTTAKNIKWLSCSPRFATNFMVAFHHDTTLDEIFVNCPLPASGGRPEFRGATL